jgi:5-methylcytosine-specific restriction endonuclease McrA
MSTKICKKCSRELPIAEFRRGVSPCRQCERDAAKAYRQTPEYLAAQEKYRSSSKGVATAENRNHRPDVMEKKRDYNKTEAGRAAKKRYASSERGRTVVCAQVKRYQKTEKGNANRRKQDKKRANAPHRKSGAVIRARRHYRTSKEYRDKELARTKEWRATDAGAASERNRTNRRRALKKNAVSTLTSSEWREVLAAAKGRCCYCRKKFKRLTMDHVIPLSKGGAHSKENVVAACKSCNSRKRAKIVTLF